MSDSNLFAGWNRGDRDPAVLFQGTGGTIGDHFIAGHIAANHPNGVYAVKQGLRPELGALTRRLKVPTIPVEELMDPYFGQFCSNLGFTPSYYLKSTEHYRNLQFKELHTWSDVPIHAQPLSAPYAVVHVTSSFNYKRPPIKHLDCYLHHLVEAGLQPVFMGTAKEEELFISHYGDLQARYEAWQWRFGKDSLDESLSLVSQSRGVLGFSSWTTIYGALQKLPCLEFWDDNGFMIFSQNLKHLLGSPVNLVQTHCNYAPTLNFWTSHAPFLRELAKSYYPPISPYGGGV